MLSEAAVAYLADALWARPRGSAAPPFTLHVAEGVTFASHLAQVQPLPSPYLGPYLGPI